MRPVGVTRARRGARAGGASRDPIGDLRRCNSVCSGAVRSGVGVDRGDQNDEDHEQKRVDAAAREEDPAAFSKAKHATSLSEA